MQQLWQSQAAKNNDDRRENVPQIIQKLGKLQNSHRRINQVKTFAMLLIAALLVQHIFNAGPLSNLTIASFGFMLISTIVFVVYYWRVQFQLEALDFRRSSREFLLQAIAQLRKQIAFFGWPFRIYASTLLLGVNGTGNELWHDSSLAEILGFHLGATVILLIAIFAGLKFRYWRFRRELDPLIEEMQGLVDEAG